MVIGVYFWWRRKIYSMVFCWHQTNKNQQQMKLMKSYLNNLNLKNQHIKREHQQKKVKWMKYERNKDNEQRKNTREKKDKITWQVIIHSTFFFFDYSFLFHFLDDYFQLIQIEISFWYSSCSLFDRIFLKMLF